MKKKQNENAKTRPKVKKRKFSFTSDSDSDGTLALEITSEISEKTVPHKHGKGKKESLCSCKECKEFYHNTKKKCDWLCCAGCKLWLHDDCTIFDTFCVDCGRKNRDKE